MLNSAELANMRREEERTMVERVTIINRVRVSDNAGGSTFTESIQFNVPCKRAVNLAGNVEQPTGGQLFSGLQWVFTFPAGTVITNDAEIVHGSERFSVFGVTAPETYETARRVFATKR